MGLRLHSTSVMRGVMLSEQVGDRVGTCSLQRELEGRPLDARFDEDSLRREIVRWKGQAAKVCVLGMSRKDARERSEKGKRRVNTLVHKLQKGHKGSH